MPSKPRPLVRTLIPEEVEISDRIQTVRLHPASPVWIQNWGYAWDLGFGVYGVCGLRLGVGFAALLCRYEFGILNLDVLENRSYDYLTPRSLFLFHLS